MSQTNYMIIVLDSFMYDTLSHVLVLICEPSVTVLTVDISVSVHTTILMENYVITNMNIIQELQ